MRAELQSLHDDAKRVVDASFAVGAEYGRQPRIDALNKFWQASGEDVTNYVMAIKVYDLT